MDPIVCMEPELLCAGTRIIMNRNPNYYAPGTQISMAPESEPPTACTQQASQNFPQELSDTGGYLAGSLDYGSRSG